ncbi:hypothetical protein V1512DRAFT_255869 [Lipomyces arxii]|uniref:uncharacterized protein n=1 Tax=Lipomyces arxii TaxID=56418 RepID=UPI0034CF426D
MNTVRDVNATSFSIEAASLLECQRDELMYLASRNRKLASGLSSLNLMAFGVLWLSDSAFAANDLLPNLTSNMTIGYTNVSTSRNYTVTNSSTPSNATSVAPTFVSNIEGFLRPNKASNLYFIFFILLGVVAYFVYRHIRKRRRLQRARLTHDRRTQALREDVERVVQSRPDFSRDHWRLAQPRETMQHSYSIRNILGNELFRTQSSPPPPPYSSDAPSTIDLAYLGGARLPIYEDAIQEEDEPLDNLSARHSISDGPRNDNSDHSRSLS